MAAAGVIPVSVVCDRHGETLHRGEAETPAEARAIAATLIVAGHAEHASCPLRCQVGREADADLGAEHELQIRCLDRNCRAVTLDTTCPVELVPALALVFHTSHEGHRMQVSYAGREWTSPVRK